jgi:5-methylcytosine-specific restriction protein B
MIHVFGIKYGHIIKENQLSAKEILKYAGMSETYVTEIHKGMRLAKYVTLKANCSDL